MKNSILTGWLAISLMGVAALPACSKSSGSDESAAQQRRDAKALEERFDLVRGTYEGTISNPTSGLQPQRAKLLLYVVSVRESANPDGSVRIRPALYGRFQLVDLVTSTDYVSLTGDYDELGTLSLTSLSATGGSSSASAGTTTDSVSIAIKGEATDGRADIQVMRNGGLWGQFQGTRTTFDASAPSTSDSADYRDRLLTLYSKIEGNYVGILDGTADRPKVAITITTGEDSSGVPMLMGQFRRLDLPVGVGEKQLAVSFDSTTSRITFNAIQGGGTSIPGSGYMSGSGTWVNDALEVSLRDRKGSMGVLRAIRNPLN